MKLWLEISRTIMYLKNLWPHNFLKVIGSKSWVLILKISRRDKFRPRSVVCRLLGYEGLNQYILWKSKRDIIIYARDVIIDEWNTIYNKIQSQNRENNDENIKNLLCGNEMENVSELYKPQLENSPSQPENIENLLCESGNEMEDVVEPNKPSQLENSLSQLENTSTQFIPTSIDINDLVDEYAGVDERENHQNRRDDDYVEKEQTNQNQNQQSQQVERNRQNIRVDDYVEEELTDQNQQSQQVERERQAIDRPRRIKIPSYKARQNMISIDEVPESTGADIVP